MTLDPERSRGLAALDHQHLWHPSTLQSQWTNSKPLIIHEAEGSYLVDVDGKRYLDGCSSLWTNVHGHRHARLDAALVEQSQRMAHSTLVGLSHPPAIHLAARLSGVAPWGLTRTFFSDNGSTAVEVALKMALHYHPHTGSPQRTRFATLAAHFQRPMLSRAVTLPSPVQPGGDEEERCLSQAMALLEEHGSELAALVVEPLVQVDSGMKMHTRAFLEPLLTRAKALGVLVIADETAVGFGRTGTLFAMEQVGLSPDLLCLAKGLSAGYLPLAATMATEAIHDAFLGDPTAHRQYFHGDTFTGNPLACAVALTSLDLFEEDGLIPRIQRSGRQLQRLLVQIAQLPPVGRVRQTGLMVGIDLQHAETGHRVALRARTLGAILHPLGDTIVINPPLSIADAELTELVQIIEAAIRAELPIG